MPLYGKIRFVFDPIIQFIIDRNRQINNISALFTDEVVMIIYICIESVKSTSKINRRFRLSSGKIGDTW
jgi:hypothetical protein